MILSHHVTIEQREQIKILKKKMREASTDADKEVYQKQLNSLVERIFLEHKMKRYHFQG
ncbi:hypothetical protein [Metabacillus iocasae]|uniref:Uncharacterized protein n=1 Tax=Priestia iocasae TaxID=2291674 RepID=A0ABS2QWH9_9BACI|nr:hypothetical protein [Metabacillus iocasae]MBM7703841.1 hypothetical protein [Metabacillus iocasae]